jgi:hypothetical protein
MNSIIHIPNFMKMYQSVQKLLLRDTQADRQIGDLISLLSFLESKLKVTLYISDCLKKDTKKREPNDLLI